MNYDFLFQVLKNKDDESYQYENCKTEEAPYTLKLKDSQMKFFTEPNESDRQINGKKMNIKLNRKM